MLEDFITGRHLDVLCRLMLASSLCLTYAYIMDAFTDLLRRRQSAERTMFIEQASVGILRRRSIGQRSCSTSSFRS